MKLQPRAAAPALLLLLLQLLQLQLSVQAGNYDSLIAEQEKRNQLLHARYLQQLQPGQAGFLENLDARVAELQQRHAVQDSRYPQEFDHDRYWAELLSQPPPVADEEAEASANRRDEEEPFMNKVWGAHHVSGGAGELGQVTGPADSPQQQQVKSDHLPSYCDPPNPCPKNGDPKKLGSPCEADVRDSASYNYEDTISKLATGQCQCDSEHMRCPRVPPRVLQHQHKSNNNPYLLGNKRDKLDAKKSPRFSVRKRGVRANFRSAVVEKKNPWLYDTDALDTVEKKDGRQHHAIDAF